MHPIFIISIFLSVCASISTADIYSAANEKGCRNREHVYDYESRKCYQVGGQGPCGVNAYFDRIGTLHLGSCKCAQSSGYCAQPLTQLTNPRGCYEYFSQGPCKADEWLVPSFNETRSATCAPNICIGMKANLTVDPLNPYAHPKFIFAFRGKCFVTGEQAFCKEDQVAHFIGGISVPGCYPIEDSDNPVCYAGPAGRGSIASSPNTSCPEGYEEDSTGECTLVNE